MIQSKDDAAQKAFAIRDAPDLGLVADELLARGEPDAAEAFARAALRKDTERQAAIVQSRRSHMPDVADRQALEAVEAAGSKTVNEDVVRMGWHWLRIEAKWACEGQSSGSGVGRGSTSASQWREGTRRRRAR